MEPGFHASIGPFTMILVAGAGDADPSFLAWGPQLSISIIVRAEVVTWVPFYPFSFFLLTLTLKRREKCKFLAPIIDVVEFTS